jgi:hypothetical protein
MELRYVYVGATDTEVDLAAWLALPNATLRWRFRHFGADVACVEMGARPFVLVADHRPAGSVLPIYATDDLDAATMKLTDGDAWRVDLGPMGTPEGNATVLVNGSGATIAILQVDRPTAMEDSYANPANDHAVRSAP